MERSNNHAPPDQFGGLTGVRPLTSNFDRAAVSVRTDCYRAYGRSQSEQEKPCRAIPVLDVMSDGLTRVSDNLINSRGGARGMYSASRRWHTDASRSILSISMDDQRLNVLCDELRSLANISPGVNPSCALRVLAIAQKIQRSGLQRHPYSQRRRCPHGRFPALVQPKKVESVRRRRRASEIVHLRFDTQT